MGTELRRLKPETITRGLVALRAELIRDGGPGLEHVEALLALRGTTTSPRCRATAHPRFRRGKLRMAIQAALRDDPLTGREIVEHVCGAHRLAYGAMYRSVYAQLGMMKKAGRVAQRGGCGSRSQRRVDILRLLG